MKFLIAERISANKYKTPEGYLVCVDSVLARTGKQTYRKNEIFVDCNDETEIEVDRKPEEVFSEATLASFENKPITIEHPDEDVNTGNFKNLAVGFVRDIHRGKDNGQDVMLGTLVITDEEAISAVESGELLDLSCGYDCDIEDSANPQQRNIRGNHVALCENGRAGIARIVDSLKDVALPASIKKDIQRILAAKSTYTKHDLDVSDIIKEIERYCKIDGHPITFERQSIKGWFKTGDGMMRKDYVFAVRGFSNRILISMYANPDTWKTTEVNGYFIDSVNDATMKEYIFKFIPNEFTSKPVEVKFPCLNNELALATLRRSWTWIKMISVTVDGKEVKYQNGKIIDSEETEMKDKLIDIPSDILGKIESLFKARNIKITGKGKTWTGRVHYQVEFVGKAIDLKKKLDLIEKQVETLKIPMTYAIGNNKEDTLATAGVDFDKQSVADSDVEDVKEYRIFVNGSERVKWEANSAEEAVKEFMEANPAYANHKKGKVEARDCDIEISDDEDLITKAINDEVTAIELYNQILAGDLDDETRAIIEEIRDDENDHLVKLTKLKNIVGSDEDIEDSASEFNKYLARIEKAAKNKDKKLLAQVKQAIMYAPTSRLKNSEASELFDKVKEIEKSISDEKKVDDAGRPYVDIKVEQDFAREIESRSKRYNLYVLARQQSGKLREITLIGEKTNTNPLRSIESLIKDFELEKSDYSIKYFKDSKEKLDDAMQTFEIRWIDTYKKSKGYVKEEYLHVDRIKADSLSEALKKLADDVALAGVGTMNAMIVSIHSDKASYMYSGKLGELVRKVKDSSKIERAIQAISSIKKTK